MPYALFAEGRDRHGRDRQRTDRRAGLRFLDQQFPTDPLDRGHDPELPGIKVDRRPTQAEQLATAQTQRQCDNDDRLEVCPLRRRDELACFIRSEERCLPPRLPRCAHHRCHIPADQIVTYGLRQRGPQHRVDVLHRPWRQTLFRHAGHQRPHVAGRQRAKGLRANARQEVPADDRLVPLDRLGPQSWPGYLVQPHRQIDVEPRPCIDGRQATIDASRRRPELGGHLSPRTPVQALPTPPALCIRHIQRRFPPSVAAG